MLKKLVLPFSFLILAGCTAQKVQPVAPFMLPAISQSTTPEPLIPTQEELLHKQPVDERPALTHFIKTHQTPIIETSQSIQFPFGRFVPKISCLPLRACDITLQPGERVTGVYPGDTSRWLFEEALSGEEQMHIIFKPKEVDIATNVIITTTRRTYHLDLDAKQDTTVKAISFYYPDDFLQEWSNLKNTAKEIQKEKQTELAENTMTLNHIDFNYRIETPLFSDKPRWTPSRVFNNGKQVYIQMPEASQTMALPALFVLGNNEEPQLVNYRIRKPYYIVDQLFQKAILTSGVGKNQQRVTITYNNKA